MTNLVAVHLAALKARSLRLPRLEGVFCMRRPYLRDHVELVGIINVTLRLGLTSSI